MKHKWVSSNHKRSLRLLALLSTLRPLPLSLRIYLRRKRVLKGECNLIAHKYQRTQSQARRLAKPQRRADEAHHTAPVHRTARNIEREARHNIIHQNAEVVAQIRARHAQRPHARQN